MFFLSVPSEIGSIDSWSGPFDEIVVLAKSRHVKNGTPFDSFGQYSEKVLRLVFTLSGPYPAASQTTGPSSIAIASGHHLHIQKRLSEHGFQWSLSARS
jgi:hypothetical protein